MAFLPKKAPVVTSHDLHFCKMWPNVQINLICINFIIFLKYNIIRLWFQVISSFLYRPPNVNQTFMS